MKKQLLSLSFAVASVLALQVGAQAQTVIESFENAGDWVVAGNDINDNSATASVAVNTTDFTEGAGSLAFTYSYSGNAYFEVGATKTFSTPRDFSDAMEISVDIKGDANSQEDLVWYAVMRDIHGQGVKVYAGVVYENGPGEPQLHAPKDGAWKRYTFSLAELGWHEWQVVAYNAPKLNAIESITFYLQKSDLNTNAATTTVLFDNLVYNTTSTRMTTGVIDDFNYADTAALEAIWSENYSGGSGAAQSSISLNTTDVWEGSGAMQIDYDMALGAQNYSTGQRLPLASAWDVSGISMFEIAFAGDSSFPVDAGPLVMVALQDSAGNRARWRLTNGVRDDNYSRFALFTKQDAPTQWGAANAWEEEEWDAGGDLDKTDVTKVVIYLIDGGTEYPYETTVLVDSFKYHTASGEPIESDVMTNVNDWTLFQ